MTFNPTSQRVAGFFFALFLTFLYYWWRERDDLVLLLAAFTALVFSVVCLVLS